MEDRETLVLEVGGKRYVDCQEIGHGGFSKVYRATDAETHEAVAVKVYKSDFNNREIEQVLNNSVRTHGFLDPNSRRFPKFLYRGNNSYSMSFIEGCNLGCLDLPQREDIVLAAGYQIALCLDEFHKSRPEKPIIHRDLKPGNIIIRQDGGFVLTDFDFAYIDEQSVDMDRIIGTQQFLSPEHISGKQLLPISDLFSLGSTLYNLLTGKVVIKSDSEYLEEGVTVGLTYIHDGNIGEVIATCWRRRRTYESAEHMVAELRDRLKRNGINFEKSQNILAQMVKTGFWPR